MRFPAISNAVASLALVAGLAFPARGPALEPRTEDLSGFTRFFFWSAGPCSPATPDAIARAEIRREEGFSYVLSLSLAEDGVLVAGECVRGASSTGIRCVREEPLPERPLTEAEVADVFAVFSGVTIEGSPEAACEVMGHACSYDDFRWDDVLTHDPSCFDNQLEAGTLERVLGLLERLRRGSEEPQVPRPFLRGDPNSDGKVDISDAVAILAFLFLAGPAPGCARSADANDSGAVDISDGAYLLGHLFLGGPRPPAPFPACGADATQDGLTCLSAPGCG
ncbi:MAG: hypothetical protein HY721_15045 [Planctomycetes bacterium]|nr:hypothetical protein [Planctomycetota bacterium]